MFLVYVGVSKTITEHLVIRGCHHGPDYRNESSLCMEISWVLLQVYMKIDVILLLDNFWMEVDCYMCVQMLGGMYNTRWPINEIHHALRHRSRRLHFQSLPLIIFESDYHFTFSILWRERRKMNVSTKGNFVGITGYRSVYGKTSPDSEMGVIHMIVG